MIPGEDRVARFAADLAALVPLDAPLGLAVSGGPDSLALLLLAVAVIATALPSPLSITACARAAAPNARWSPLCATGLAFPTTL